jgi:hypothetical protein
MSDLEKLRAETAAAKPETEGQVLPTEGREDVLESLLATLEGHPELFDPKAVEVVRPLFVERVELGVRRYRRRLQTFNSRDAHLDELQEALDRIMYAHQAALERRALEVEVERLRAVLAEEHARVLELQRTRDELQERLDEQKEAVDELSREVARHRPEPLAFRPPAGGPVVLVLPDDPATRKSLLDVLGPELDLVANEKGELVSLTQALASQIADSVFGRDGGARVQELRETVLGAQPIRFAGLAPGVGELEDLREVVSHAADLEEARRPPGLHLVVDDLGALKVNAERCAELRAQGKCEGVACPKCPATSGAGE